MRTTKTLRLFAVAALLGLAATSFAQSGYLARNANVNANRVPPAWPWMRPPNPVTVLTPQGESVQGFFDPVAPVTRRQTPASFSNEPLVVPGDPTVASPSAQYPTVQYAPLLPALPIEPRGRIVLPARSGSFTVR